MANAVMTYRKIPFEIKANDDVCQKGVQAFSALREQARENSLQEMTLDEINEEIRLAREEIAARKKNAVDAGDSEKGRCSIE